MKTHTLLSGLCPVTLMLLFAMPQPLPAEPITNHGPGQVKNGCKATNGLYSPPNKNGVYSCTEQNGDAIICGGVGPYKNTCEYTHSSTTPGKQTGPSAAFQQESNLRMSTK